MGSWQLEVARMAIYVMFPVVMFHYFNQPENFEEWVIKTKKESMQPDDNKRREDMLLRMERFKEQLMREELQEMEQQYTQGKI